MKLKLFVGMLAAVVATNSITGCSGSEQIPPETKPADVKLDPAVQSAGDAGLKGWDPKKDVK